MMQFSWKAGLTGAALIATTIYAAAQMQMPQMSSEQMMAMMKQMSQMTDNCSSMMRGGATERGTAPAVPEKKN
jgi:homoserine kinase